MSKYILATSINWADEADVNFFEIIDDEQYKKYQYLCDKVKILPGSCYFGSNEGFEEDEFDYLGWTYREISEEEAKIIKKYMSGLSCQEIYDDVFEELIKSFDFEKVEGCDKIKEVYNKRSYLLSRKLRDLPYDEFTEIIDEAIKYPKGSYLDACDAYNKNDN